VFAGGFLFMGVGYGGGGFSLSDIFTGSDGEDNAPQTFDEQVEAYQAQLAQDPENVTALTGLATLYQQNNDPVSAAHYLELVIVADPSQKDVYMRLANLYMADDVGDYTAAVAVLNKATEVDAQNPDIYLKLGIAQNALGNRQGALLAWQKFLQLAPDDEMASVVREQVDQLTQTTTTTSPSSTTTTAP
jgi:cytochrome c-type biogenesis protein CcmH/NrfG